MKALLEIVFSLHQNW